MAAQVIGTFDLEEGYPSFVHRCLWLMLLMATRMLRGIVIKATLAFAVEEFQPGAFNGCPDLAT